jgi:hypothetical protein
VITSVNQDFVINQLIPAKNSLKEFAI